MSDRWSQRFFATTRGQVVLLLRQGNETVDELARALDLTDNAVRSHLAALERDGLVRQGEMRRGSGKPAFTYVLTPEAERLFPRAYGILMSELLDVLSERLSPDLLRDALRQVGHRVAARHAVAAGTPRQRVERAIDVLGELGGLATVESGTESERVFVIQGCSCPLAEAVEGFPGSCELAEALLADVVGTTVTQCCDPGPPPRCRFEVRFPEN